MVNLIRNLKTKLNIKILQKLCPTRLVSPQQVLFDSWFRDMGDLTLRQEYDLNESSIVFDVGGYLGQFASDIYSRYNCQIYIFEPVLGYFNFIKKRFHNNDKIKPFNIGLGGFTREETISVCKDGSSIFKNDGSNIEFISLIKARDFIEQNQMNFINLMKINVEGGEYELLDHIIQSDLVNKIDNIQIQFHDFIPNAREKMELIQRELTKTHYLTYQYEFVWENWKMDK